MLPKPLRMLWGDLSSEEVKKFGFLSFTFFFVIGSYWLLRPLKDGIFKSVVGMAYQPRAKMLSLCVLIPLILLYSKLVDLVQKQKLFYVICTVYSGIFLVIAYLLTHPTIGLANTVASPKRMLGWVSYFVIESLGSIIVALFWSFVISVTDSDSAKKGYPLILAGAQIGSILGPTLASNAKTFGLPLLTVFAAIGIIIVPFLIKFFITFVIDTKKYFAGMKKHAENKSKSGMMEGLKLLLTKPYLLGVFAIATFYEVIGTIVDYQMKVLAAAKYTTPESFTSFMGMFGQTTNLLAFVLVLLGTSYLLRKFGLTFCLLIFPIAAGLVITNLYLNPTLWMAFTAMIVIKGVSYAVNNPAKEMMYIPTSKDVKFKAKSWIDMFGQRGAKATGAGVNNIFKTAIPQLMLYGTVISLGLIGVWIVAALFVGKTFNKLTKEGKIID